MYVAKRESYVQALSFPHVFIKRKLKNNKEKQLLRGFLQLSLFFPGSFRNLHTHIMNPPCPCPPPSSQVSPISPIGKCVANMSGVVVANKSRGTQSKICRQYVIAPWLPPPSAPVGIMQTKAEEKKHKKRFPFFRGKQSE